MEPLNSLLERYVKAKGWSLIPKKELDDLFEPELISHLVINGGESFALKLLDWKRAVGVDQAIRLQRFCENNKMPGILASTIISDNTVDFCRKHGILQLKREDMNNYLKSRGEL